MHHGDAVAHLRGTRRSVRDEQDRKVEALAHIVDQAEHLCLNRHVERRNRLGRRPAVRAPSRAPRAMQMRWRCPPEN